MNLVEIDSKEKFEEVKDDIKNTEKEVLFFTSNDCPPCKAMSEKLGEVFEEDEEKWGQTVLFKIHAESAMELVNEYSIKSVPTIVPASFGKPNNKQRIIGGLTKNTVRRRLNRHFLGE